MGRRDEQFTLFAQQATPGLWRTALMLAGDQARADDLLQQTLVRTYVAWPRVRRSDATAFARRVMINLNTDTWRRTRYEDLVHETPETTLDVDSDAVAALLDRMTVLPALSVLTARERSVIVLRHLLDMSDAQISSELGIAPATVRTTAHRALRRMREALTDPARSTP